MGFCEPAEPEDTVTDRLNYLLSNGGPGYVLALCRSQNYNVTDTLIFTSPQQEIITFGFPTDESRAMLTLNEFNLQLTTAVDGTCVNCNGVKLRYLQVNGSRNSARRIAGGAIIEMGGPNSDQVVEYVHSFNPRSWSCLHVSEGYLNCTRAIIQNNDIGPCGGDQYGEWADGLSIACANSTVRNNLVSSPTDGGIVLFGSPGTIVENNTISIETATLLGGINLVDYNPWSGDYKGTIVRQNTIIGGQSNGPPLIKGDEDGPNDGHAIIKIGIAVGSKIWFGEPSANSDVLQGGLITNNVFKGAFSFAIAAASILDFTILDNALVGNSSFIGFQGLNCSTKMAFGPQPFIAQTNSILQSTLQADFVGVTDIDLLICFVPPGTGDYWPFESTPAVSSRVKGNRTLGLGLGITLTLILVGIVTYYVPHHLLREKERL